MIIGALALAVMLIIVGSAVVGNLRSTQEVVLPAPSVSGGDARTEESNNTTTIPVQQPRCVSGDPDQRVGHPDDGRVYGGNLSFPAQSNFEPAANESRMQFGWDVSQQVRSVHDEPGWVAQFAVGQLRRSDGFSADLRQAAEQVMACLVRSRLYQPFAGAESNKEWMLFDVGGTEATAIRSDILVDVPELGFPGDRTIVVVVADGEDYGYFFGAVPLGDLSMEKQLVATMESLRIA